MKQEEIAEVQKLLYKAFVETPEIPLKLCRDCIHFIPAPKGPDYYGCEPTCANPRCVDLVNGRKQFCHTVRSTNSFCSARGELWEQN